MNRLIKTPNLRPLFVILLTGGLPMAAIGAFVVWDALSSHFSPAEVYALVIFMPVLVSIVVWLGFSIGTFYAVELTDGGVRLYNRGLFGPGPVLKTIPWSALGPMGGSRGIRDFVMLEHDGILLGLPPVQARAIATDPRYPCFGRLPAAVTLRLAI